MAGEVGSISRSSGLGSGGKRSPGSGRVGGVDGVRNVNTSTEQKNVLNSSVISSDIRESCPLIYI